MRAAVRWLSARTVTKVAGWNDRRRSDPTAPPSWTLYDAITGLAGTGRMLLAALQRGHREAEQGLLAALTALTTLVNSPRSTTRPGWWLPPDHRRDTAEPPAGGLAETGMAHGIAGPLALLSTAATTGYVIDGQTAAIGTAASWLLSCEIPGSGTWPTHVTGTELDHALRPTTARGRCDAWCYGTPGISRALQIAGEALRDPSTVEAGRRALACMTERRWTDWDTEGAALCHGAAGVLQCAIGHPTSSSAAAALSEALDPEDTASDPRPHIESPDPGLLTGTAGIALALADCAGISGHDNPSPWDAALLLS